MLVQRNTDISSSYALLMTADSVDLHCTDSIIITCSMSCRRRAVKSTAICAASSSSAIAAPSVSLFTALRRFACKNHISLHNIGHVSDMHDDLLPKEHPKTSRLTRRFRRRDCRCIVEHASQTIHLQSIPLHNIITHLSETSS